MTRIISLFPLVFAVACSRSTPERDAAPSTPAPSAATISALATASARVASSGEPPAPSTTSSAPSTSPPPGINETCEKLCAYSRQLKCGGEQHCVQGCIEMAGIEPCTPAFRGLYSCLLREPLTHWECGEDRMGAIRDGYCEKEQEAVASCVEKLTQR